MLAGFQQVISNYNRVKKEICVAAESVGRDPETVSLVVVCKNYSSEYIKPILDLGHIHFAENKVQEAYSKWVDLKQEYNSSILHLIGPLQTNKVVDAINLFEYIHTIDREKLVSCISKVSDYNRCKFFIQVNTGEEKQKSGAIPDLLGQLINACRFEYSLDISGLMCIPPVNEESALHFSLLHNLAIANHLAELSMGMSSDFTKAVEFGATYVRVGSAIFNSN